MNCKTRKILRAVSFMLLFVLLLFAASYVLFPKNNEFEDGFTSPRSRGFYSLDKDTVDIAIIGNSSAYGGISPMEMWNAYGLTSYIIGEPRQNLAQAANNIKELISSGQNPKLVILETDSFFETDIKKITNSAIESFFPCFKYHDNWKHLNISDLINGGHYTRDCWERGQLISTKTKAYQGGFDYLSKKKYKCETITPLTRIMLERIELLCSKNNISVMMLTVPNALNWNEKKHDAVEAYAKEKGIKYIDLNYCPEKFGFDWSVDTRDKGNHLNADGAKKVTLFFAKDLAQEYSLTDHRGDAKYSDWDTDYKTFTKEIEKLKKKHDNEGDSYFV